MLKQEKMPKKKLIFYTAIIAIMFFATGFMIYKNYKLTAVDDSADFNNNLKTGVNTEAVEKDTSASSAAELDIFNDQKFQGLKRNLLKKVNFIVGKEDPFEAKNTK